MTGNLSTSSQTKERSPFGNPESQAYVPKRTVMDAFNHTSYYDKDPEVGFGTGSRPPLMMPTTGPGTFATIYRYTFNP